MKQLWQTWIISVGDGCMGGYYIDTMALFIYMIGDNKHLKPTKTLTTSHTSVPHAECLQRLLGCQLHAWPWCNYGDRAITWRWSMSLAAAQSTECTLRK